MHLELARGNGFPDILSRQGMAAVSRRQAAESPQGSGRYDMTAVFYAIGQKQRIAAAKMGVPKVLEGW